MIIKYLHTFLLGVILSYSSFAQIDLEKVKENYREVLSLYPKTLTEHFLDPEKANIVHFGLRYPGVANLNQVNAIFICDSVLIDTIEKKIIQEAVAIYHFTDSCFMIVDYDSLIYDTTVIKLKQCNNLDGMFPIPNFEFCLKLPLPTKFYEEANIYVLGAEKGKFLAENLLWSKGVKFPDEWENGYTKGVVVSGNIVVYWLAIW